MNKIECKEGWESQLTPGQLYCVFTLEEDGRTGEWHDRDGALVYWTGSELVYEDGDRFTGDVDWLVPQVGSINPKFKDDPWNPNQGPQGHRYPFGDPQ